MLLLQHVINIIKLFMSYKIIIEIVSIIFCTKSSKSGICSTLTTSLNLDAKFSLKNLDLY